MKVVNPVPITAAKLVSSTVPEPAAGEVVHDLAASYVTGDEVISLTTHKKYTSLQGAASVVTLTIATPCVVTWPAHGRISGEPIVLSTTGALPAGLVAGTTYYTLATGADTFNLAATAGGVAINTTGAQSGVHTATSNANKGKPLPVAPEVQTDWWKESGTSLRHAPFDHRRNSQAVGASPMIQVFAPGERGNCIASLGMVADSITIEGRNGGVLVKSWTSTLRRRRTTRAYEYAFGKFETAPSYLVTDAPPFTGLEVTVILTRSTGDVSCGSIIFGTAIDIGETQLGAESDILGLSLIEVDPISGETELTPRRAIPLSNQVVKTPNALLGRVKDLREALNAVPALWFGLDDGLDDRFELVLMLAVYERFKITLDEYDDATCNIDLREI